MPMNPANLKSKIKERVYNGLKSQFGSSASKGKGYSSVADENWKKIAEAISGIAVDIIMEISQNAEVMPGAQVVGAGPTGPISGSTVTASKIL